MTSHAEFDRSTEAATVVSAFPSEVKGRVFLITGVSTNGIGGATAKALASQSPRLLVLTGRSEERVKPVISDIQSRYTHVQCRFLKLDLASESSVREAASEVNSYDENVDVQINNAGVAQLPERTLNGAGIEMHFAINHIGHFLLTNLIMPKLLAAAISTATPDSIRIVNVASMTHLFGPVRFSDINFNKSKEALPEDEWPDYDFTNAWDPTDRPYNSMAAYAQSKTANILFTMALNQKLQSKGIQALAVHPGIVQTDILRYTSSQFRENTEKMLAGKLQTVEQGASTTLVAALDSGIKARATRVYLGECQFEDAQAWATNETTAGKLWALSERLLDQTFSP